MFKTFCLVSLSSLLLFTTACVSGAVSKSNKITPAEARAAFFRSMPAGNGLVFIGSAGKRSDPKETLQLALEDAAQQVAVFYRVYGEYAVENNIGSGAFDYTYNTHMSLQYDVEGAKQYVDGLQFDPDTDTLEMENALIVRTTYPLALSVPVAYRPAYNRTDQKPSWVDDFSLAIPGYEVGIGYSPRYSSFAETCTRAYHSAIFSIIRNVNTVSKSSYVLYQNTGSLFGYKTSSDNITYSYGTLTGFYVLDTWVDPTTSGVWTLAIAKKSE